jgi:UDP-sulfoquinovose synthase
LAERIQRVAAGMDLPVEIQHVDNPRREQEEHYYKPAHRGLLELGLQPHFMTDDAIANMLDRVRAHRDRIIVDRILPRVRWR